MSSSLIRTPAPVLIPMRWWQRLGVLVIATCAAFGVFGLYLIARSL